MFWDVIQLVRILLGAATMSPRLDCPPTSSLLVLEPDAVFPFEAIGYRGSSDTAILVQQRGETPPQLARRIRREARELALSGSRLTTVLLIVGQREQAPGNGRRTIARVLIEQLSDAEGTLVLVADRAGPELRHDLMTLVGELIEHDGIKQSIAADFETKHMAQLRATGAPLLARPAAIAEGACAQAC